jgi:GxxExxY protein
MHSSDNVPHRPIGASSADNAHSGHLPHSELTNLIIGGMFEVHNALGAGFLEAVYANALTIELRHRGLRVDRNVAFEILYRGAPVGRYVADLIVDQTVIVEVKAAKAIDAAHRAQVLNYLRASALEVGLVANFGSSVQFKRVIATAPPDSRPTEGRQGKGNSNT